MKPPHRSLLCAVAISLCAASPALGVQQRDDPEALAREGLGKIVRALELMLQSIPQYETPEINEHGDIIIRRKRPHPERRLPEPKRSPPRVKPKEI
jgi:hypothetical protein